MGLFLSQLDYGDIVYRFACLTALSKLDLFYHAALRYISQSASRTHHCILYNLVGWSPLTTRRMLVCFCLGHLPSYICFKFIFATDCHNLRANVWFRLRVPFERTDFVQRHDFKKWMGLVPLISHGSDARNCFPVGRGMLPY